MTANSLTLHQATKADLGTIERLLEQSWAVHTRLLVADIGPKLETCIAFVVRDAITLRGFLMVEPQPPDSGLIIAAALHDNTHITPFLDLVLPAAEEALLAQNLRFLLQIGSASWLTRKLFQYGFEVTEQIVTYEWETQPLPQLPPHPLLAIRSAHLDDLATLLELDQVVFGPTWRKPRGTFREALGRAVSFSVGQIGEQIVAYEWCDRFNTHAHLTRLATHPDYRRQGIAGQLLAHTIQFLLDRQIKTISLNTQTNNLTSQRLYQRFGFKSTHQIIDVYQKDLKK